MLVSFSLSPLVCGLRPFFSSSLRASLFRLLAGFSLYSILFVPVVCLPLPPLSVRFILSVLLPAVSGSSSVLLLPSSSPPGVSSLLLLRSAWALPFSLHLLLLRWVLFSLVVPFSLLMSGVCRFFLLLWSLFVPPVGVLVLLSVSLVPSASSSPGGASTFPLFGSCPLSSGFS